MVPGRWRLHRPLTRTTHGHPNHPTRPGTTDPCAPNTGAPTPVLTFSHGTLVVNSTIPPGRYEAASAQYGCYWERLSGFGGSLAEIIANDFQAFAGRVIVDISAADAGFTFNAACGTLKTYVAPASPADVIVPGAHVVGANITPGTYFSNAAAGCYWERLRSFNGTMGSIITNDFMSTGGSAVVTISPSDVGFHTDGDCGTWTHA